MIVKKRGFKSGMDCLKSLLLIQKMIKINEINIASQIQHIGVLKVKMMPEPAITIPKQIIITE